MVTFERPEKPFLTVETGEAYQPIRLSYEILQKTELEQKLNQLLCLKKNIMGSVWDWFWHEECEEINFASLESYRKNKEHPTRLGTLLLRNNLLTLSLPSFKRACLAIPFFHRLITPHAKIRHADFINKVYAVDERLPHGFAQLFKDEELEALIQQRMQEYELIEKQCAHAASAEEAVKILTEYSKAEAQKKLPFTERYLFEHSENEDPDVIYLGFYIFLRGRELVAIRRFQGDAHYSLADAAESSIGQVFASKKNTDNNE